MLSFVFALTVAVGVIVTDTVGVSDALPVSVSVADGDALDENDTVTDSNSLPVPVTLTDADTVELAVSVAFCVLVSLGRCTRCHSDRRSHC